MTRLLGISNTFLDKLTFLPARIRYHLYRRYYDIHRTFSFNGRGILLYGNGHIHAGEGSYIGRYSQILAYDGCKVLIGRFCRLSHFIKIYTMNYIADQDLDQTKGKLEYRTGDVVIGDYSWIGAGVFINEGCRIGENAVVGANSVVTGDIPPHSIAAGVPAKVIRFKSYLSQDQIDDYRKMYFGSLSPRLQQGETETG